MPYDFGFEVRDFVATLTFDRPDVLNALTFEVYAQLRDLFEGLRTDDSVHAVVLTGFTSVLHMRLGTVDPVLVGYLLIGSIPGALLGTRLSNLLPGHWLKRILCCALLVTGARMLMV